MRPLLQKLNARPGTTVTVLHAPPEVEPVLDTWAADVRRELAADVETLAPLVAAALADDAVLWFAYPKKASKRYRSDVSQMQGWQPLGDLGLEAVRQVSIDADWSALRFRPARDISTLRRQASMAMSTQGKQRVAERRGKLPRT